MSKTINQVYIANPITSNAGTDLMYFGQSPYGAGNDAAMLFANFAAQLVGTGTANQLAYYAASGHVLSGLPTVNNGVLVTNGTGVPSINTTLPSALTTNNLTIGNININNNTIQANNSGGNLNLLPNATGIVNLVGSTSFLPYSSAQVQYAATNQPVVALANYANNTLSSYIYLAKSRSAVIGSFSPVSSGDTLGEYYFAGDDGSSLISSAAIQAQATGTISTGIVPSKLVFYTMSAAGSLQICLTIGSDKVVTSQGPFTTSSPTIADGTLSLSSTNNSGNYANILTNLATTAARTWSLPDASGTIALSSSASGIVNSGLINQLSYYAAAGTTLSGLTTANNGILVTSAAGVPSIGNTVGAGLTMPSITFNTTSGIIGTTTNNSAAAGSVGEEISSNISFASRFGITTNVQTNVTSISLTAGDWDVSGIACFYGAAATVSQFFQAGLNTTSATLPDTSKCPSLSFGTAGIVTGQQGTVNLTIPPQRISIGSTTTIYLVAYALFTTSTTVIFGDLNARRVR